eukprot:TRINITY_DN1808_c0_g1_i2.p1 TRINITY_DN1808_c0_g1~~TRINITY_DN1808_c0_g1_i2.p1  ORF type:complete len:373 (-),score=87.17 TRINITY_DN1808_c0_g1_i2:72-1190(-)
MSAAVADDAALVRAHCAQHTPSDELRLALVDAFGALESIHGRIVRKEMMPHEALGNSSVLCDVAEPLRAHAAFGCTPLMLAVLLCDTQVCIDILRASPQALYAENWARCCAKDLLLTDSVADSDEAAATLLFHDRATRETRTLSRRSFRELTRSSFCDHMRMDGADLDHYWTHALRGQVTFPDFFWSAQVGCDDSFSVALHDAVDRLRALRSSAAVDERLVVAVCDDQVGFGVFANCALQKDEFLSAYRGAVVRTPQSVEERVERHYAFGMELFDVDGLCGGTSVFHVDGEHWRNVTPLINHSRTTNLRGEWLLFGGFIQFVLFAAREIEKGEQLCYSYGDSWCRVRGIDERDLLGDSAPLSLPGFLKTLVN